jgi:TonB family protein
LAALFATRGGGNLPAQLSADLALEIVLNEIVEQACLATGASGAAVALLRGGEMVCSASSGANAPELGTRLDSDSGLTAECVATRHVQRCDDAQNDPRADIEASRSLGVRSVMVVPLLRNDELLGILEVFSSRAGVFRERDEVTLGALVQRILKNLEQARATTTAKQDPIEPAVLPFDLAEAKDLPADPEAKLEYEEEHDSPVNEGHNQRSRFDMVTFGLSAAIVVAAVLFGALVGVTLRGRKSAAHELAAKAGQHSTGPTLNTAATAAGAQRSSAETGVGAGSETDAASDTTDAGKTPPPVVESKSPHMAALKGSGEPPVPAGGLLVYENGKEIFRMPPQANQRENMAAGSGGPGAQGVVQPASDREEEIVQLPPQTAEGSVAYRVEPEYPEEARQQNIQGPVVLEVRIARDGAVQEVKVLSGQPLLADAAMAAVKQWRFKPRRWQGHAVEMQTKITLNFRMPT